MLFLVPHSSHLTQPLDLGVFGRLQNIMRDEAAYSVNVKEMQTPLDQDECENEPAHVRVQRGKQLAEYLEAILDAFERTATRRLIVSAFEQAGLLFDLSDDNDPNHLETYVDPSKARALNDTQACSLNKPRGRNPGFQIWISTFNPNINISMPTTAVRQQLATFEQRAHSPGEQTLFVHTH